MARRIFGQIGKLKPEMAEVYVQLHGRPWPELLDTLKRYHFENYSIFRHGDFVFSYFEYTGEDYEADMLLMEREPVMLRWWTYSKPCFSSFALSPQEEYYADMQRIFHLP
ncbi:MAG TPA: L-rhamnose mutarotase [Feifaniaceae bacterium]|nr:L-rhamnose mutarotase [Feifaniaceae bacterium]